jgi:hypothetical protein
MPRLSDLEFQFAVAGDGGVTQTLMPKTSSITGVSDGEPSAIWTRDLLAQ